MKTRPLNRKDFEWVFFTPKDIAAKVPLALAELKSDYEKIKQVPKEKRNKENTLYALERAGHKGALDISTIAFLAEVHVDSKVRDACNKAIEDYSREAVDIEYDPLLYKALKEFVSVVPKSKLTGEEQKMVKEGIRDYKRMGFDLPEATQKELKKIIKEQSKLAIAFRKNINDYKDHITLSREEAVGLPDSFLSRLAKDKKQNFVVSLDYPEIGPFMEMSPNDLKRKELADKNLQKGGRKNIEILDRILELRQKKAKILGYKTHADYALELKMAKNTKNVYSFINGIIKKATPLLKSERAEVLKLKQEITGDKKTKLTYYDGYYFEEHKRRTLKLNGEEVRQYFPFETVKRGVFEIYSKLLGVRFEKVSDLPLWHKDVEAYAVLDKNGDLLSYFATDLFPREGKYKHYCASDIFVGHESYSEKGKYEPPFTALLCNFPAPSAGRPSLLSHDEVETFFHEFGHVMHQSLYRGKFASQTGFNVAHDFIEAMSQMLENWVWQEEMLPKLSANYQTGKPLPKEMLANLLRSKNHMIGNFVVRQLNLALFDMEIHSKPKVKNLPKIYEDLTKKNIGTDLPREQIFPAGFGHLLGYDAGYYGYMWSKVFAEDMFTRFKKEGLMNAKVGGEYRKKILEPGSSREEMKMVTDFLKRRPNNKAFLQSIGVK